MTTAAMGFTTVLWAVLTISRVFATCYCSAVRRATEQRTRPVSFEIRAGIPRSPGHDDAIAANPGWTVPGQVLREGNLVKLGNFTSLPSAQDRTCSRFVGSRIALACAVANLGPTKPRFLSLRLDRYSLNKMSNLSACIDSARRLDIAARGGIPATLASY